MLYLRDYQISFCYVSYYISRKILFLELNKKSTSGNGWRSLMYYIRGYVTHHPRWEVNGYPYLCWSFAGKMSPPCKCRLKQGFQFQPIDEGSTPNFDSFKLRAFAQPILAGSFLYFHQICCFLDRDKPGWKCFQFVFSLIIFIFLLDLSWNGSNFK